MNTAWVLVIILLAISILMSVYIVVLKQEMRKLREGRQFFSDKCNSCTKRLRIECPRCTLYLTECQYYLSHKLEQIWANSDPYEK